MSYDSRRLVGVKAERVTNVSSTDFPGHYPDEDHQWNLPRFRQNLKVQVQRLSNRSIEFDVVGIDASIANAFRRIMIAEVPTIAIEKVYIWQNTSVIQDEVLAHRMGLIPLNVNPAEMLMMEAPDDQPTDRNTIVFDVDIVCSRRTPKDHPPPPSTKPGSDAELYVNHELLSSQLVWKPAGEQEDVFADAKPGATNGDIVLAKLRPGQEIKMVCHAVKGVGKDHAKFSPVATASYRLLPAVFLHTDNPRLNPIPPHLAEKFQSCFSPGVINIDPRTKTVSVDPHGVRRDTVSREVLRHKEFDGCVELGRVRDHFLFNIESESAYLPEQIFPEAIVVLREKITKIRAAAEALLEEHSGGFPPQEDVVMS